MQSSNRAFEPSRILSLGDSYTIGEAVSPAEAWPAQLADALRERGVRCAGPRIIARTGWTTDELSTAIDGEILDACYGLVTLLVGVNNQYRGRGAGEYRMECHALLARAIGFAGGNAGRVVVVSIPDWGVTPFAAKEGRDPAAVAREIDAYNDANRAEARQFGARYVDVTGISRLAATDPSLLATDGLHPSGRMYALWTDAILPAALAAISS